MSDEATKQRKELTDQALSHLEAAIDLLDLLEAPGHIACHADLAARQLEAWAVTEGLVNFRQSGASSQTVLTSCSSRPG